MIIKRVVIIGTGLMGCSLGLALKKYAGVAHICGIDVNIANAKQSYDLGIVDAYASYTDIINNINMYNDVQNMLRQADWVILAIPVCAIEQTMLDIRTHLKHTAILSDLGSTKQNIIAYAQQHLSAKQCQQFIPLHPIAGSEKHGPSAANVDLFLGKPLIITPFCKHQSEHIACIKMVWKNIGVKILHMHAQEHDDIFAAVSHLPHILAFALMQCILDKDKNNKNYFDFVGSGFKDFTRIAASSPHMWVDIIKANQSAILLHLDAYINSLHQFRALIQDINKTPKDGEQDLFNVLLRCSTQRQKIQ